MYIIKQFSKNCQKKKSKLCACIIFAHVWASIDTTFSVGKKKKPKIDMHAQVGTASAINNHMIFSWHQSEQKKKQNCWLERERVWWFFPQLVPVPVTELSIVNKSVSTKIYLSYLLYMLTAFKKSLRCLNNKSYSDWTDQSRCSISIVSYVYRLLKYDMSNILPLWALRVFDDYMSQSTENQRPLVP